MNSFTNILQTVPASWFGIAYVSVHLVKQSQTTRINLLPLRERGRGPMISISIRSIGSPTKYCLLSMGATLVKGFLSCRASGTGIYVILN